MPGDFFGLADRVIDGQFHVLEVAGEGGFSVVYRGQHLTLREPVAIKCLKFKHKDEAVIASFTQRFFDESRIMYRLSQGNLNIVRAITTGVTVSPNTGASVPYMVLEWLSGVSLSKVLKDLRAKKGPGLPLATVLDMFEPAALAIAYAHSQGVVHRDIKPGNLFVQGGAAKSSGPHGNMKVLDFGMAKVLSPEAMGGLESAETINGVMVLSPQYVTPEQLDKKFGPIGPWTDVYSFALILVEALTARRAREAETFPDLMLQITAEANAPTPRARGADVSAAVDRVFSRAFARDVKTRWPDMEVFWRELKKAASMPAEDIEERTSVAARIDFGGTLVMPTLRPSQPGMPKAAFGGTMPLSAQNFAGTLPLKPTPQPMPAVRPVTATAPPPESPVRSMSPRPFASPMSGPAISVPAPPPPEAPAPTPTPSPPAPAVQPKAGGRGMLVAFFVLFIVLSLGASGFMIFRILKS
jgi:serine/threonine protein kinase